MGFLDNSGDIILDAVLTDTGRKRLAAADGSFRIAKFALADDEIDYGLYRNANSLEGIHPSGSAYYDLNILQTPVLEAFTNNTSTMKSRLVSYSRNDLLYLPVIKNNDKLSQTIDKNTTTFTDVPVGGYLVTADYTTSDPATFATAADATAPFRTNIGILRGNRTFATSGQAMVFDQGIDNVNLSVASLGPNDPIRETQYLIEMDNRLSQILSLDGTTVARPSFVDDDDIASYYISLNSNSEFFAAPAGNAPGIAAFNVSTNPEQPADTFSVIGDSGGGRYGTRLSFRLLASENLSTSNVLFNELGGTTAANYVTSNSQFRYIDTNIRLTGFTTGYRVDIPVRFIKKV
jgi:hypothetical protein|tara:strand:+ start:1100 stop:2143 length:1044 start_codon:yes stop_codon:yes gene_type:complete